MKFGVEDIPIGTVFKIRRPTVAIIKKHSMDVQKGKAPYKELGLRIGRPKTKGTYTSVNGTKIANIWFDCLAIYLGSDVYKGLGGRTRGRALDDAMPIDEEKYFGGLDYAVVYILKKPRLKDETKNSGICTIVPTALLEKHSRIIDTRLLPDKGSFVGKKIGLHKNIALYCLANNIKLDSLTGAERSVSNIIGMSKRNAVVVNKNSYKSRLQYAIWSKLLRLGALPIAPTVSLNITITTSSLSCRCSACGFHIGCESIIRRTKKVKGKKNPRFVCLGCKTTYKVKVKDDDVEIVSENDKHRMCFPNEPSPGATQTNNTGNAGNVAKTLREAFEAARRLDEIQRGVNVIQRAMEGQAE